MFGEISIWAWMGAAIMFAIGGATGFFISRQMKDKRTLELEEKLAATRTELADYRGEVNQHFLKTSLLVSKLTNDYREVYEHLATGAQKLCNEKPRTQKLDLPDTKILPTTEVADTEVSAIEQASDISSEASSETTIESQDAAEQLAEVSSESTEQQVQSGAEEHAVETETTATMETMETTSEETPEQLAAQETERPAPEDIPSRDEGDEEVPLGAESAPSVDTEPHKTHPAIH